MKKLLILGASELQLPAIHAAKQLGYHVIVADNNPNAVGKLYSDEFYPVSTLDFNGIFKLSKEKEIDGIYTIASDQPMNIVAEVGEALNLNTISKETAINTTDKGKMRSTLKESGIEVPFYLVLKEFENLLKVINQIPFPCIIKPTKSSGSKGVILVESKSDLKKKFNYAKKYSIDGEVIVEEFMEGKEYSVESITHAGVTRIIAITEKYTTGSPNFIETGHNVSSNLPIKLIKEIGEYVILALKALKLELGPAHTEIIITSKGPRIVEIGPRLGGDYISSNLVPLATGYDMVKDSIRIAMSEEIKEEVLKLNTSVIRFIYTDKEGVINRINGTEKIEESIYLKELVFLKKVGDYNEGYLNSNNRIGYFILSGINSQKVIEEANRLQKQINIEIN